MKLFSVKKYNVNGQVIDYGGGYTIEDVKAITRGYKQDDVLKEMYNRVGSKWFFEVVEEIEE